MKRILCMTLIVWIAAGAAFGVDDVIDHYQSKQLQYTGGAYDGHVFKYRLLTPEKIEPGRKYPLVLFLHGAGERGDDNKSQLKYLPTWMSQPGWRGKYNCYVLAPQCPTGRKWVNVDWSARTHTTPEQPSHEMRAVIQMLQRTMANHPVDADRIYLTGLSMGGYGSWDLAVRHPDWFAAVAPICGGGDERMADRLVDLPVWAWHGEADRAVPVQRSRNMIQAVRKAGGEPKYTELDGVGHNSWTPAYTREDGVLPWLFKQRRASK